MVYPGMKFHHKMSVRTILALLFVLVCFRAVPLDVPAQSTPTLKLAPRGAETATGIAVLDSVENATPEEIQSRFVQEILAGNIPNKLRSFAMVQWTEPGTERQPAHDITIWVAPDYLGVGEGSNFMRVPLTPQSAHRIADAADCLLPTTKMVDHIYKAASQKLAPQPLSPTQYNISSVAAWKASNYLLQALNTPPEGFVAGHKKDVVITSRLAEPTSSSRVAIYGWHKLDGHPIQPLTTVHKASYVDYSHGVRLVSNSMLIDGATTSVESVLTSPGWAYILSTEGPLTTETIRYNVAP